MKEIQASVAKARFSELLDEVERGETIAITRHGKTVARLIPDEPQRSRNVSEARADIEAMRRETGPATREDILAWRAEGRK